MQYIICRYSDPSSSSGGTIDTTGVNQVGAPYGYDEITISTDPLYPGAIASNVYKYSQLNRQRCLRIDTWHYLVTAAQTQLLMAEARYRGWITTSTAQAYYENGVKQALQQADMFATARGGASPISDAQVTTYLARPNIVYADATALKQINEQYWLACFLMWHEGWCNFRRSGYPQLTRINYSGEDASVHSGDGFIHRLGYTLREYSANKANTEAAATAIGGDKLATRVFWDAL
ncbi:MAG: SusD/RagB family nutrient-binding outer membrane lipoprotein, partial [Bacteroidia bacterium]|nr:SusD/RagB family nutrient-binding outer membrane lipoprotein [Bacteroidia bacterium]